MYNTCPGRLWTANISTYNYKLAGQPAASRLTVCTETFGGSSNVYTCAIIVKHQGYVIFANFNLEK